jgi:aspartate/methionine/tyrosine aminotransferase
MTTWNAANTRYPKPFVELRTGLPYANLIAKQGVFAEAVGRYFKIDAGFVLPTPGTTGAIEAVRNHAMRTSGRRRPRALTVSPGYWRARESFQGLGFEITDIATRRGNFSIDESELLRVAAEQTPDLLYLSLPNNPTGAVFDPESLILGMPEETILAFDLTLPSRGLDTRAMVEDLHARYHGRRNLFFIGSTSKSHGTAEQRIGWAVCASADDADTLRKENRNVVSTAAVDEGVRCLQTPPPVMEKLDESFSLLKEGERAAAFRLVSPPRSVDSVYVLVEHHVPPLELRRVFEEEGIRVMWGSEFGLTDDYIRLETLVPSNIMTFVETINGCYENAAA